MSAELSMFENSFFSDPFSSFIDSAAIDDHHHDDIFETIPNSFDETNSFIQESPLDDTLSIEQIASVLLSSSPPRHQLENLSLFPTTTTTNHLPNRCSTPDSANGCAELPCLEVKTEEWSVPFDTSIYGYSNYSFVPSSCLGGLNTSDTINAAKLMQRSFSSICFDNETDFLFQPRFNSLMESPNFQSQVVSSPESSLSSSQMRKVCSTGDLQMMRTTSTRNILSSSPLSTERSFLEDAANIKVGRYSAEERKERIDRYRAKRTLRNFNKTIKYACRKTLADTRPRIRGRFARSDEAGEIPKTATTSSYRYENEDYLWTDGFHDQEDEEGSYRRASFFNSFRSTQYHDQYYSY